MNKSIFKELIIVVGFFLFIWATFYYIDIFPEKELFELSVENEEKIGDLIIENMLSHDSNYKKISTPLLDSALHTIEKRIIPNIGLTDYDLNISVVDNPGINAITLPGGNIMIFKGLILATDSPEELAGVLCHEIGHVEKRHVVSKLAKEFSTTILFSILTGGDPGLLNDIIKSSVSTVFDRGQEAEADDYALVLLEKSNISPEQLSSFFEKLKKNSHQLVDNFDLLSTHPKINSRIKKSKKHQVSSSFEEIPIPLNWNRLKNSLK
jgi:predicted Zn-dependent protease